MSRNRPSKIRAAIAAHDAQAPLPARAVPGQSVFDAVIKSLAVHVPALEPDKRIAIATDIAIKVRGFVDGPLTGAGVRSPDSNEETDR